MNQVADQNKIIDEAIQDRLASNIPLTCMTFALTDLDDTGLELYADRGIPPEELYLMRCKVTDQGMRTLNRFPGLAKLDVSQTSVSTQGLQAIVNKSRMESLTLGHVQLGDGAFQTLAGFENLTELRIDTIYLDPFIHYERQLEDAQMCHGIEALSALRSLRNLNLRGLPLQADPLDWLSGMQQLESVDLSNTHASASAIMNLANNRQLKDLGLSNTELDDETLRFLVDGLTITDIGIASTQVTDEGVAYLVAHSPLQSFFAENVKWSREACRMILEVPTLEWAELHVKGVPSAFLEKVAKRNPRLWLHP